MVRGGRVGEEMVGERGRRGTLNRITPPLPTGFAYTIRNALSAPQPPLQ